MLLDTSIAKTISTPSLLTVSSCVPILGFINPNTNEIIERLKRIILKVGLNLERFGLNSSNNSGLAKLF